MKLKCKNRAAEWGSLCLLHDLLEIKVACGSKRVDLRDGYDEYPNGPYNSQLRVYLMETVLVWDG